ncbi:ubiquinone biosynthesis O-methyltransferase [Fistulina hepatica ATCC 64428]|nr:ubiquinone biosynthesis O-methyltransferase [Fistulina hepatica ATCC 64428]
MSRNILQFASRPARLAARQNTHQLAQYRRAIATSSSINPGEIQHFSRLSSQWWDEQGEFGFLHQMNPIRMQFVVNKLREIALDEADGDVRHGGVLRGLDVLDVGCGGGLLSESLARCGASTLGVDASESNIAIASLHASSDPKLSQLEYRHSSAEALLEEPKRFDVVCSMEVVEHVDNPAEFLNTCAQLLKPSGHLFLSTVSRTPLARFLTIFMAEDVLRRVAPGTHTYSKFIKPDELVDYFKNYTGGSLRSWINPVSTTPTRAEAEIRGMIFNPLNAVWTLGPRNATWASQCNYLFWVRKPSAGST